jgi:hypothetical protein
MQADSLEIQPYQQGQSRLNTPYNHRLVVIPNGLEVFDLPSNADVAARVKEIAEWTDWSSNGQENKAPIGGLLIGLPGVRYYDAATDNVLHALKCLQWLASDQDLALTILAHNLRRDNVDPLALWGAKHPGKAVRADLVFDAPAYEGFTFERQLSVAAWRVYNIGFNGDTVFDSLDNGEVNTTTYTDAVSEVVHLSAPGAPEVNDLAVRQFMVFSTGVPAGPQRTPANH